MIQSVSSAAATSIATTRPAVPAAEHAEAPVSSGDSVAISPEGRALLAAEQAQGGV
jgi:hypothetical protein